MDLLAQVNTTYGIFTCQIAMITAVEPEDVKGIYFHRKTDIIAVLPAEPIDVSTHPAVTNIQAVQHSKATPVFILVPDTDTLCHTQRYISNITIFAIKTHQEVAAGLALVTSGSLYFTLLSKHSIASSNCVVHHPILI